jgi:8-oxo-dGTP diphosphatase
VAVKRLARGSQRSGSTGVTVDVAILVPRERRLGVLGRPAASGSWELPWSVPAPGETLLNTARRIVRTLTGKAASWIEQTGAIDAGQHPSGAALSIGFVAAQPDGSPSADTWTDIRSTRLNGRQRRLLDAGLHQVRVGMEHHPVAFRMLPPRFSLGELQAVYEILLDRALHKATFRRALEAAKLVQPTNEWLVSGRGRPARLYRLNPRRRGKRHPRVRLDRL